jgi:rod shape determining protein RodA
MLVAAGTRPLYLGSLLAGGLLLLPVVWLMLREYMRQRILTFFAVMADPESDIFGEGYNILQARISIGSGGLTGRGFFQGTQNQFEYLRIKHSDFIFSVLAEELGFIGGIALFALFVLLLFRVVRAAERARDPFGRLVAFGVGCMLFFQAVANLGANLTLLPVTGIPLPLVSFGGSSLLTNLVALGLIQSILIRRLKYRY